MNGSVRENPWHGRHNFTEEYGREYVLKVDEEMVRRVASRQKDPLRQLRTHVPPEPWCGPIESARVLVLSGNPRWNSADEGMPNRAHELMLDNLSGNKPMFWLLPEMDNVSGSNWYKTRLLNRVIEKFPREHVAQHLCQVDYYGYRSEKWDSSLRFESQEFSFGKVREAMTRGATVVITMACRQWVDSIPELLDYPRAFRNSSWENKTLSVTNTKYTVSKNPAEGFAAVIEALESGKA